MFLSFLHFLFTAERSSARCPLWLASRQVPGRIFPCGKNLHPAARAATLTAHILPCPTATPKTEADRQANQPPFPSCHCTGRTAAARLYRKCRVFPLHPRLIQKLIAATPEQSRAVVFWRWFTHCEDENCIYKVCRNT